MAETETTTYPRCPKCGGTDVRVDCTVVCVLEPGDEGEPEIGAMVSEFAYSPNAHAVCTAEGCGYEGVVRWFLTTPPPCDFMILNPRCPTCDELADGTLDVIRGKALLNIDEATGVADYDGETKVLWDTQQTVPDGDGNPLLICPNGHEWSMEQEEDTRQEIRDE